MLYSRVEILTGNNRNITGEATIALRKTVINNTKLTEVTERVRRRLEKVVMFVAPVTCHLNYFRTEIYN